MRLKLPVPASLMLTLLLVACSSPESSIEQHQPVITDATVRAQSWEALTPTLENSRALAGALGKRLVGELQNAMTNQGPSGAINVCRDLAPKIASELSRQSGANVGRTSRQYRNPQNAPESWQEMVLANYFDDTVLETDKRVEYFVRRENDGVRYMQAIRLGGVCVTCHGQNVAPEVSELLAEHYPHDLAKGYAPGDLRGAFTISWPGVSAP